MSEGAEIAEYYASAIYHLHKAITHAEKALVLANTEAENAAQELRTQHRN